MLCLKKIINSFIIALLILFSPLLCAAINPPKISIIIDDLGYDESAGLRVADLPGAIVCSILPDVQFSKELAVKCHAQNKEVILHTPMEALTPHHLGPGGLYMSLNRTDFINTLNADIKAIPFVSGLNNHEGSRLTAATQQMDWLMQAIKPQGLFYIDSVTSAHSIAEKIAKQEKVPGTHRDVFLDNVPTLSAVRTQFELLLDEAAAKGQAVAIGHPYPATLTVLAEELPRLAQQGYVLVPVSQLILSTTQLPQNLPAPFLKQIAQQITVSNVGFAQLATIPVLQCQPSMAKKPASENKVNLAGNNKPAIAMNAESLLHRNFCSEYPNLCYLLPGHD